MTKQEICAMLERTIEMSKATIDDSGLILLVLDEDEPNSWFIIAPDRFEYLDGTVTKKEVQTAYEILTTREAQIADLSRSRWDLFGDQLKQFNKILNAAYDRMLNICPWLVNFRSSKDCVAILKAMNELKEGT